ncbi:hypothetical protein J3B02_000139 [Coemansia erecta]|uniref:Uncharacterized protein n=1 Tax=Coemansia asiatica TaxID=1052880 RepID=A0A9W7XSD0_9FUNG|nr:hypothetical protein LPJ64_000212 [Coemansia asiatica]KAJ2858549.1 hypothetical protein J3B02_000139 [Coemansia erecta]KAJ2889189.1 hypothetical protein FB639_000058 [Coemansia asiatica]
MDAVLTLQTYIDTAAKYAFPALLVSAAVFYISTTASEAWRQRQRNKRQAAEDERRRQVYEARLSRSSEQVSEQPSDEEKKNQALLGDDRPQVIRSRLPATSRNQFGATVATLDDTRSRITGPSRSCVIGSGGSCCG